MFKIYVKSNIGSNSLLRNIRNKTGSVSDKISDIIDISNMGIVNLIVILLLFPVKKSKIITKSIISLVMLSSIPIKESGKGKNASNINIFIDLYFKLC